MPRKSSIPLSEESVDWMVDHRDFVLSMLRKRLPESYVEDYFQEVSLAAMCCATPPSDHSQQRRWLATVVSRSCALHWRQHYQRERTVTKVAANTSPETEADPLEWLLAIESKQQIRDAVESLSLEDQQVLIFKVIQGWTHEQLAEHFGVTNHVAQHRYRAVKKRLKKILLGYELGNRRDA